MNIKDLQNKVYLNTLNLGYVVNKETTVDKLKEELKEFDHCSRGDSLDLMNLDNCKTDAEFKKHFELLIKNTEIDEIPDMFFVLLSYCEERGYNFETLVKNKLRYNTLRTAKH